MEREKSVSAPEARDPRSDSSNDKKAIYSLRDCIMTVTNMENGKFCSAFCTREQIIVTLCNMIDNKDTQSARLVLSINTQRTKAGEGKLPNSDHKRVTEVVPLSILGVDWAAGIMTLVPPTDIRPMPLFWDDIYQYAEGTQVICIGSGEIGEGLIVITYIAKIRAVDPHSIVPKEVMFLGQEVTPGSVVISTKGVLGIVACNRKGHALALTEKSMRLVKAFTRLSQDPECKKYPQILFESGVWVRYKFCVGVYGRPVRASDGCQFLIGYLVTESDRDEIPEGSIITHVNGSVVGDRMNQLIGSHILWSKTEACDVVITVSRLGKSNCEEPRNLKIKLIPYPSEMDSPDCRKYCM
jgi:hypothetical protein